MRNNNKITMKLLTEVGQLLFCAAGGVSGGRPTKGLVVALPHQEPCHAVHLAASPSVGE